MELRESLVPVETGCRRLALARILIDSVDHLTIKLYNYFRKLVHNI